MFHELFVLFLYMSNNIKHHQKGAQRQRNGNTGTCRYLLKTQEQTEN